MLYIRNVNVIAFMQLNFIGHPYGLSKEETKDLWVQADIDGNNFLDYKEFQVLNLLPLNLLFRKHV